MSRIRTFLLTVVLCTVAQAALYAGNPFIVSQEAITGEADYGSGAGQSFLLPPDATITGIQLHIGSGGGSGPDGGSVRVDLWRAQRVDGDLVRMGSRLATGTLLKSEVEGILPGWFAITFDTPYQNTGTNSRRLVFDFELLTSGSTGWNNYSFSDGNPYPNGRRVRWSDFEGIYTEEPAIDLTFRIVGTCPETSLEAPCIEFSYTPPGMSSLASVEVLIQESVNGLEYTCYESQDLGRPLDLWKSLGTQPGTGGPLNWGVAYGTMPAVHFFYVKVVDP